MQPFRRSALLCCASIFAVSAAAADPSAGLAYVSNQQDGVSVIDLSTMKVTGSLEPGASSPRGIGVTEDGKYVITANRDSGTISILDRADGSLVRQVRVGTNPEFVRVRGNRAFVTYEPSSEGGPPKAAGGKGSGEAAGKPPHDGTGNDDDDDDKEPAHVAIVDIASGNIVRRITGGKETEGVEFSADGKNILITNEADDSVTVHRIADGRKIRTISTAKYGKRPRGVKMSPDGKTYVVSLEFGNALMILDAKYKVVKSVPTGETPYGVAFDRKGERLYVALAHAKMLQVFDAKSWTPVGTAATGERCWHFTFTPDDSKILAACGRSNEIVVIDPRTLTAVARIPDAQMPWGIVTWPKSVGSLDVP